MSAISRCIDIFMFNAWGNSCQGKKVMSFLGIKLSSVKMMAQLPVDKLRSYSSMVMHPNQGKQEYEMSIIVWLQFALSVIVLVKAFICRLIDRTIGLSAPVHYVTLNEEAKKDLDMRKNFCSFTMAKEFSYHRNRFLVIFRYLLMPQNLHVRQSLISNGLW